MAVTQIFVLGLQRSGTTWVGNLLEAHPDVAAVAAKRHQGIHESLFFSHFARAWDWNDMHQRDAAVSAFLDSDYCELMQLYGDDRQAIRRAGGAAETFAAAMDLFAWGRDASAWVEKSPHHTRHAETIARDLPDARFVAIHRDTMSLLASRLHAYGRRPPRGLRRVAAILRGAASNAWHKRLMDRLERRHPGRVVQLDYACLARDGDVAIAELLARLDLAPVPGLAPRFQPNSSFADRGEGVRALGRADRILARIADRAVALVPGAVLAGLRAIVVPRKIVFPAWVWRNADHRPPDISVARPRKADTAALRPAA